MMNAPHPAEEYGDIVMVARIMRAAI